MADTQHAEAHAGHGPTVKLYLLIGLALSIFTAISFLVNGFVKAGSISVQAGFVIILAVAIIKATLVGAIFMHLKWDYKYTYFMLIPAFILATMMMIVLLPDMVLAWKH
jgi:cytochrome c oxidase subunit IV